jgi:capsid protein
MGEAAGYYTKGQIVSMLGNDLDDNIQQIKSEQEQLKESGVQLDLDLKVVDVEIEE